LIIHQTACILAIENINPGCRCVKAADNIHEGGFTRTRWAHYRNIFILIYFEGDRSQGIYNFQTRVVIFYDGFEVDNFIHTGTIEALKLILITDC
jgi:hypothetical protein